MVIIRKSSSKSKNGCHTCKVRHVKCDECRPRCQRCMSTGRKCEGYDRVIIFPSSYPSTSALATRTRVIPFTEEARERRSFEFFRNETVPTIIGFFGSPLWNLVLQACNKEPVVGQAAIALGAFHERLSVVQHVHDPKEIETDFPVRQHAKALGQLRHYLAESEGSQIDIILICALIHLSIETIQKNYLNALIHLENSLRLLRSSAREEEAAESTPWNSFGGVVDIDLCRAFVRLDLHASAFQGMGRVSMTKTLSSIALPSRLSSIIQAKDVLDQITAHFHFFNRTIAEEYKYRKLADFPLEAIAEAFQIKAEFDSWNIRFEKFLRRPTSKFNRQEQLVVDVLIINHRIAAIQAATCIHPETMIFDEFDAEFDEIVTLAANFIRSRRASTAYDFQIDIGIISPLYLTAIKCREPWIRQRAMSLLRSIKFQEGVWSPTAQVAMAQVAINRENSTAGLNADGRPVEFARVHSVGANIFDPVKRVAEVNLTQKLNGLDSPWHNHVEWCSW